VDHLLFRHIKAIPSEREPQGRRKDPGRPDWATPSAAQQPPKGHRARSNLKFSTCWPRGARALRVLDANDIGIQHGFSTVQYKKMEETFALSVLLSVAPRLILITSFTVARRKK
jgi:hypothetical protein